MGKCGGNILFSLCWTQRSETSRLRRVFIDTNHAALQEINQPKGNPILQFSTVTASAHLVLNRCASRSCVLADSIRLNACMHASFAYSAKATKPATSAAPLTNFCTAAPVKLGMAGLELVGLALAAPPLPLPLPPVEFVALPPEAESTG